jgi:hypothetical protein
METVTKHSIGGAIGTSPTSERMFDLADDKCNRLNGAVLALHRLITLHIA